MRRLTIISFFLLLTGLGCQEVISVDGGEPATLTYSVSTSVSFEVKSGAEGSEGSEGSVPGNASEINVLWYGVYHKKADGTYKYMSDMSAFVEVADPNSIQVPITLINGQEYELVFVAQHRILADDDEHTYMYTISDDAVMSRNPSAALTSGEQLDVFVFVDRVGPVVGSISKSITLERPVAQINVGTSDAGAGAGADASAGAGEGSEGAVTGSEGSVTGSDSDGSVSGSEGNGSAVLGFIDVAFDNVPKFYDIRKRTYSGTTSLSFNNLPIDGTPMTVYNTDYTRLATLYILGGNKVDLTILHNDNTKKINNINTAPNYKTNIVGKI